MNFSLTPQIHSRTSNSSRNTENQKTSKIVYLKLPPIDPILFAFCSYLPCAHFDGPRPNLPTLLSRYFTKIPPFYPISPLFIRCGCYCGSLGGSGGLAALAFPPPPPRSTVWTSRVSNSSIVCRLMANYEKLQKFRIFHFF